MKRKAFFTLLLCTAASFAQKTQSDRDAWNQPFPPFHIIGNIYYVGVAGVSSFLIKSDHGLVLLDGGLPESAPLIAKNIQALGFQLKDVHILLNSHAHFDHAGGLAELKRRSGAQFVASRGDQPELESGRALNGTSGYSPIKVDRAVNDGEKVQLGNVALTALVTAGHTRGCTSWSTTTEQNGKPYRVLFYCSTTVAGNQLVHNRKYPQIVSDYEASFRRLRDLPCDVFLGPHAGFFDLSGKKAALDRGKQDAFVDPGELRRFIDHSEQDFRKTLAEQQGNVTKPRS